MAEFWRRCAGGEFSLQRCGACDFVRYPPSPSCPRCGADGQATWIRMSPPGSLMAWTITRPAARDRLPRRLHGDLPYALGLVAFPELTGYYIPVRLRVSDVDALSVGDEVAVALDADEPQRLVAKVVGT